MSLTAGQTIAHYRIVAAVGAGGMGEVYRAHDSKLNRDVAIKVLPEAFAADAERLARFTREAQTLAALNHPNIATIYGVEESGGVRALVMELVAGDDLMSLQVKTTGALVLGERRKLLDVSAYDPGYFHDFDVSADGQRFLLIRTEPESRPLRLDIILNWFDELRRQVG